MTQTQQKQPDHKSAAKKPLTALGWFRWGLRWFSVIVFALLFCIGLLLSVSWKILLCLAVIPVTAFFLPKKVQSWVWLCLTGVLLGLFIWVLLPELNKENWTPYQFNDELEALQNDYLPAGIANAADSYQIFLDEYGETIFHYSFSMEDENTAFTAPWNPQDYPELDNWATGFEPALQRLIEITQMEYCRFAIPHDLPSLGPQMERINR
jgi:energy-coupling factor transporter transmembrane protein EcfT